MTEAVSERHDALDAFDRTVDLPVAARTVPDRRYASAGELAAELSRSAWITREFRLRPA